MIAMWNIRHNLYHYINYHWNQYDNGIGYSSNICPASVCDTAAVDESEDAANADTDETYSDIIQVLIYIAAASLLFTVIYFYYNQKKNWNKKFIELFEIKII